MSLAFKRSVLRAKDQMRLGAKLMHMHTTKGMKWFLLPGGEVKDDVAAAIIKEIDVRPCNDGMFPGINQTWGIE